APVREREHGILELTLHPVVEDQRARAGTERTHEEKVLRTLLEAEPCYREWVAEVDFAKALARSGLLYGRADRADDRVGPHGGRVVLEMVEVHHALLQPVRLVRRDHFRRQSAPGEGCDRFEVWIGEQH